MASNVKYNSNSGILEIVHTGRLTIEGIEESTSDGLNLHKKLDANAVLIDASKLESVENFIDLYDLPKQYDEAGANRNLRIALVMPKTREAIEAMQFYDNVCNNRGWVTTPFDTRDEATEWLLANQVS